MCYEPYGARDITTKNLARQSRNQRRIKRSPSSISPVAGERREGARY
jgi:hypothetical protein